jgi:hypothetical protein
MVSLSLVQATLLSLALAAGQPPGDAAEPGMAEDPAAAVPTPAPLDGAPPAEGIETVATGGEGSGNRLRDKMIQITVLGGLGLSVEGDFADSPYWSTALELQIDPADIGLTVGGSFNFTQHRQTYTVRNPVVQGVASLSDEEPIERWFDARLTVAYNTLHTVTDVAELHIGLAPRYVQYLAVGFDSWFFAPEVFGLFTAHLSDRVNVDARFGFAANVAGGPEGSRSIGGLPQFLYDYGVGFSVDLTDTRLLSLELRWQSHTEIFELTDRWYHGAMAGLRLGI